MLLDEILERLNALPEDERKEVEKLALEATADKLWIPNPGPQTLAYYCEADQLLYGGEAGGGKSDLLIGLALQEHGRSLLLRRVNRDVSWLIDRTSEIVGSRQGYNGQDRRWRIEDRVIDFGGVEHSGDEQRWKGRPRDLLGLDEATDFLESQVDFLIGWVRTTKQGQRCRTVFATNPPTTAEGEWIVRWFAPWVDPMHPLYPYPMGELLWTARGLDDEWLWFDEPGEREVNGKTIEPISRTFIRSGLGDNPDLNRTNYGQQLKMLPEELRRRYAEGDFSAGSEDGEFQVIPTDWIKAAQDRWTPDGGGRMDAIGVDVAQGGKDNTILAPRHEGTSTKYWIAELKSWKGSETPDGSSVAGRVIQHQRDAAQINIDMGGGYGGSTFEHLRDAEMSVLGFVPSGASTAKTSDGLLGFANMRAEAIWKVREMLDPMSEETVALPPDPQLRADLACYNWKLKTGGMIQIESKEDIKKRLGRSPDRGDAVVIALATKERRQYPRRADRKARTARKPYQNAFATRRNLVMRIKR